MRFDELTLHDPEGELRVRFHPALTMLCGLGPEERLAVREGILSAVGAGSAQAQLHMTDGAGRHLTVQANHGGIAGRFLDGSPAPAPLGHITDLAAIRSLMVLSATELDARDDAARAGEPAELAEARAALQELSTQLELCRAQTAELDELCATLAAADADLTRARDDLARREFAVVLANLERVRAEATALQASTTSVDADRRLLDGAPAAHELIGVWREALDAVAALSERLTDRDLVEDPELSACAAVPMEVPAELDDLVVAVLEAERSRAALDERLHSLSVAKLPTPSDPLVADLGLLDQPSLWQTAARARQASQALRRLQVSLGGVEVEELGPASDVIEEIEAAHLTLELAERSETATRVPALAGATAGVSLVAIGLIGPFAAVPLGIAVAAASAGIGIVRPAVRRRAAARAEQTALAAVEAGTYLGFHIRRVEASVDPQIRSTALTAVTEHRRALEAWYTVAGGVALDEALALQDEVRAYSAALHDLGESAVEIEALRNELTDQAAPAVGAARAAIEQLLQPFLLTDEELADPTRLAELVHQRCERGATARLQRDLLAAEDRLGRAADHVAAALADLGFDDGPLDARAGALDWATQRASERAEARRTARPPTTVDAELSELQDQADRLRRPEWASVSAADAATPDISEVEARCDELRARIAAHPPAPDVRHLVDRRTAVERRVAALEARHAGQDRGGDPSVVAAVRAEVLAHLETAARRGPADDPVPVVLDEVLACVPPDRSWDLLDLLLRVAEHHQVVYLSDDAFVAAWARQRAIDGSITLLEPAPEPV